MPEPATKKRSLFRRVLRVLGVLLALVIVAGAGLAYWILKVHTQQLDAHCYAVMGGGGNTLVLTSDEGALVVDTKFGWPASQLQNEVQRLTGKQVAKVIDTHYHIDHTHGNPRFRGADFIAQRRTRQHLLELDAGTFGPGSGNEATVPANLVDESKQFQFGDDYVDVRYLGVGHTDGDVVVFLHKRSLLHTGDLFVNGYSAIVDAKGGGSYRALAATLDKVVDMHPRTIIPGHGPIATPADLARFRDYVHAVWDAAAMGVKNGKSKGEVVDGFDYDKWHLSSMPGLTSMKKNVGEAWDEAKAGATGG